MTARQGGLVLGRDLEDWKKLTRRELGLPVDRLIVATGHQPIPWHPGILAKYLAVDSYIRGHAETAAANLVVGQDDAPFDRVEFPIRDERGELAVKAWKFAQAREGVPVGLQQSFAPTAPPLDGIELDSVREGLGRIHAVLRLNQQAASAAIQLAGALDELMRPWAAPMQAVPAGMLLKTTLGRAVLARINEDPRTCAETFNAAAAAVPDARVAPLLTAGSRIELPLWRIDSATKRRMTAMSAQAAAETELYPKALLMTLLMRLAGCDLFVHGRGGGVYDRVTESWCRSWLGAELAPMAVVTATLRLPFSEAESARDPSDAHRALRRAWHDPRSVAEGAAISSEKRMIRESIERAPRRSAQRRALYRMLHAHLAAGREEHQAVISQRQHDLEQALRFARAKLIIDRRDWAFPLYPSAMIDELADEISRAAAATHVTSAR